MLLCTGSATRAGGVSRPVSPIRTEAGKKYFLVRPAGCLPRTPEREFLAAASFPGTRYLDRRLSAGDEAAGPANGIPCRENLASHATCTLATSAVFPSIMDERIRGANPSSRLFSAAAWRPRKLLPTIWFWTFSFRASPGFKRFRNLRISGSSTLRGNSRRSPALPIPDRIARGFPERRQMWWVRNGGPGGNRAHIVAHHIGEHESQHRRAVDVIQETAAL